MLNDGRLEQLFYFMSVSAVAIGAAALASSNPLSAALAGLALFIIGYSSQT